MTCDIARPVRYGPGLSRLGRMGILVFALWLSGGVFEARGYAQELVMQTQSGLGSLDPHIGYAWVDYQINAAMCGNLVSVSSDNSKVGLLLAEETSVSDDGTQIVFKLHDDIAFHNGRKLTAEDVVYSMNRVTNPQLDSPGAIFFDVIEGYGDYRAGKADHLTGVKALSEDRVLFRLSRPSQAFLMAMTTNFACVVPKEVYKMTEYYGDPVGAGPLKFVSLNNDGVLFLKPVPGIINDKLKDFDLIRIVTGVSSREINANFARGETDLMLDGLEWITTSGAEAERQSRAIWDEALPQGTSFVSLNTRREPFNDVLVRRAVNYAVDRNKIFRLLDGEVVPTTQVVPPALPEYEPDHVNYPYDPQKAYELLMESGHETGLAVDLYAVDTDIYRKVAFSIARDLQAVGINARNIFGTHTEILKTAMQPGGADMVLSDGLAWMADYPDASNFFFPILSKKAISKDGWNWPGYSNPQAERLAAVADKLIGNARAPKRVETWRSVFDIVMKDAPWVPLYHRRMVLLVSEKVIRTGPNGERPDFNTLPLFQSLVGGYSKLQ